MLIERDLAGEFLEKVKLVKLDKGKKKIDVMVRDKGIFINGQLDEDWN